MTGACLSLVSIHRFKSSLNDFSVPSKSLFLHHSLRKERKEISKTPHQNPCLSSFPSFGRIQFLGFWDSQANGISLSLSLSVFVFLLSFHSSFLSFGCIGFMKPKCQVFLFSWNLLLRRRGFNAESSKPPSSSVRAVLNEKRAVLGSL